MTKKTPNKATLFSPQLLLLLMLSDLMNDLLIQARKSNSPLRIYYFICHLTLILFIAKVSIQNGERTLAIRREHKAQERLRIKKEHKSLSALKNLLSPFFENEIKILPTKSQPNFLSTLSVVVPISAVLENDDDLVDLKIFNEEIHVPSEEVVAIFFEVIQNDAAYFSPTNRGNLYMELNFKTVPEYKEWELKRMRGQLTKKLKNLDQKTRRYTNKHPNTTSMNENDSPGTTMRR